MIEKYAIIVAGGSGSRMNSSLPKQFISIGGKPILMHTISAFKNVDASIEIIVVLPKDQLSVWQKLCAEHNFSTPHKTVAGGDTRFQSVKNGILQISNPYALVAIHDGVRPFVSSNTIIESYNSADANGSGIASVKLKDTIRKINSQRHEKIDRDDFVLVQTPQTFRQNILLNSFEQEYSSNFTDDASVVEATGEEIHLVDGSYENIKITTPEDLIFAEAFLNSQVS